MPVQPGDVIRITVNMIRNGSDDHKNVYHMRHEGAVTVNDGDMLTALEARLGGAYVHLEDILTPDLDFVDFDVHNLTRDTFIGSEAFAPTLVGTDTAEELPWQVAALVTFPTALTRHSGRKYVPGLTEASNEGDGVLTATAIAALADFATELLNAFSVDGQTFSIGNYNVDMARWAPWIAAAVEVLWSTQRRRKPGIGS